MRRRRRKGEDVIGEGEEEGGRGRGKEGGGIVERRGQSMVIYLGKAISIQLTDLSQKVGRGFD